LGELVGGVGMQAGSRVAAARWVGKIREREKEIACMEQCHGMAGFSSMPSANGQGKAPNGQ
jgi:hypothetical protein